MSLQRQILYDQPYGRLGSLALLVSESLIYGLPRLGQVFLYIWRWKSSNTVSKRCCKFVSNQRGRTVRVMPTLSHATTVWGDPWVLSRQDYHQIGRKAVAAISRLKRWNRPVAFKTLHFHLGGQLPIAFHLHSGQSNLYSWRLGSRTSFHNLAKCSKRHHSLSTLPSGCLFKSHWNQTSLHLDDTIKGRVSSNTDGITMDGSIRCCKIVLDTWVKG
jgi:hypothetical protein